MHNFSKMQVAKFKFCKKEKKSSCNLLEKQTLSVSAISGPSLTIHEGKKLHCALSSGGAPQPNGPKAKERREEKRKLRTKRNGMLEQ